MASQSEEGPDRYIEDRADGRLRYVRRVPACFAAVDPRGFVRKALRTADWGTARLRRDAFEAADNALWADLLAEGSKDAPRRRYEAAQARAAAMGFRYAPAAELLASEPLDALIARVEALAAAGGAAAPREVLDAALGSAPAPTIGFSEAYDVYLDEIEAGEKRTKSPAQYQSWRKVKERARKNFLAVMADSALGAPVDEDPPVEEVGRAHALKFWRWCQDRIGEGKGKWLANSASRDFGNVRKAWAAYMKHAGRDADNPFRDLSFKKGRTRTRPPFETQWICNKILISGAFDGLNDEARDIALAMVETGCRPSEICNLAGDRIHAGELVPYIEIAPEQALEIKTETSIRRVPLVGVSLEAIRRHPKGFPRYRDNALAFSAIAMKHFRKKGLLPTPRHSVYSLRHSFEKRMTEGGLDYGLRCVLMGHALDRPKYGDGGSMEWRAGELAKIALPFDAEAVFARPETEGNYILDEHG